MLRAFYLKSLMEAGIDEAGRGPLFGRVYAAVVVLHPELNYDENMIKDSKRISKKKLPSCEEYVKDVALDWSVAFSTEQRIDEINILHATQEAMHKAIRKLDITPEFLLVDGNYFTPYRDETRNGREIPCNCVIGGDDSYYSIAAASILAKTARDRYINELCEKNPELDERYGIASNKGYGSKEHIQGIKRYGISEWHRKTFGICKNY
jgi:ribonuclease HII